MLNKKVFLTFILVLFIVTSGVFALSLGDISGSKSSSGGSIFDRFKSLFSTFFSPDTPGAVDCSVDPGSQKLLNILTCEDCMTCRSTIDPDIVWCQDLGDGTDDACVSHTGVCMMNEGTSLTSCTGVTTSSTTTATTPNCGNDNIYFNPNPPQINQDVVIRVESDLGHNWVVISVNDINQGGPNSGECIPIYDNNCWEWDYTPTSDGSYEVKFWINAVNDVITGMSEVCATETFTIGGAGTTTTSTTTTTTTTTTTSTIPPNLKIELTGDYDQMFEYSSISVDGTEIGNACAEDGQCGSQPCDGLYVGLEAEIDVDNIYCIGDERVRVSFSDSSGVSNDCNAVHKACIYYLGSYHCCQEECSDFGCDNFVEFDCDDWECVIQTTTTTISTTTSSTTSTTISACHCDSCSGCSNNILAEPCLGADNCGVWEYVEDISLTGVEDNCEVDPGDTINVDAMVKCYNSGVPDRIEIWYNDGLEWHQILSDPECDCGTTSCTYTLTLKVNNTAEKQYIRVLNGWNWAGDDYCLDSEYGDMDDLEFNCPLCRLVPTTTTTTVTTTTIPGPTTTTTTTLATTTTIPLEDQVFVMTDIDCDEDKCEIYVDENTIDEQVVVFITLKNDRGDLYYTTNLNTDVGVTGEMKVILSKVKTCPDGTVIDVLALAYRHSDLDNRLDRLKEEVFTC